MTKQMPASLSTETAAVSKPGRFAVHHDNYQPTRMDSDLAGGRDKLLKTK